MRLLLDTHILYWMMNNDPKLSVKARQMILDAENEIWYSVISAWETATKHMKHPKQILFSGQDFLLYCHEAGFHSLSITDRCIAALETLSRPDDAPPHKDPFDRMLIAQAKSEGMVFLTHDSLLTGYQENCVIYI